MSFSMHCDPIGHEAPSFTIYGTDDFGASLLQLWVLAHASTGKDTSGASLCADAMRNWRYLQRKTALEVLDHVPVTTLVAALSRRGIHVPGLTHD